MQNFYAYKVVEPNPFNEWFQAFAQSESIPTFKELFVYFPMLPEYNRATVVEHWTNLYMIGVINRTLGNLDSRQFLSLILHPSGQQPTQGLGSDALDLPFIPVMTSFGMHTRTSKMLYNAIMDQAAEMPLFSLA